MSITDRDRLVLELVARFKQLTSSHIKELVFSDSSSSTSAHRCLKRLLDQNYLARVEQRLVGGSNGGSGQYCYQLGRLGWRMFFEGDYRRKAIDFHTLDISGVFVRLRQAERDGWLKVLDYEAEPDTAFRAGGVEIRPDMFVALWVDGKGTRSNQSWYVEVDEGNESKAVLAEKLNAYARAFNASTADEWPDTREIVFLVRDVDTHRKIRGLIDKQPDATRGLFHVTTLDKFPAVLR